MKRKILSIATLGIICFSGVGTAMAREIGNFSNFTVYYSGSEKFTSYLVKENSNKNAVINLSEDTGTAWITANMKNTEGAYRGGVNVQRGKRAEFETSGAGGYYYNLGLKKTNNTGGGSVTIKGSWSPDSY